MSKFLGKQAASLTPYTPGEQPQGKRLIKLNTNECPYPPSPLVTKVLTGQDTATYRLYPDPEAGALRQKLAERYGVSADQVFVGNGSDDVLGFSFMAFFDRGDTVSFPDPGYGFYPVYADLCGLRANLVPLREDFTVDPHALASSEGNIIFANPSAPTGLWLERDQVEHILAANPDRLVIVDEAYIDFAHEGVNSLPLLARHRNLLIIGTFSKSRAFAGLRLGYAISTPEIIAGIERIRYSFNSYNVNSLTQLAGAASLEDEAYFQSSLEKVKGTRDRVAARLRELGLEVLPSAANFLFVAHPRLDGHGFYTALRENGILVRCFGHPRTLRFARISIGSGTEMDTLLSVVEKL